MYVLLLCCLRRGAHRPGKYETARSMYGFVIRHRGGGGGGGSDTTKLSFIMRHGCLVARLGRPLEYATFRFRFCSTR